MHWGEPEIIATQLRRSKEVDQKELGLVKALEVALRMGGEDAEALKVVQTLTEHTPSPKRVSLYNLMLVLAISDRTRGDLSERS